MRLVKAFALRLSPVFIFAATAAVPAQKSGAGPSPSRPASPPRLPTNSIPTYSTGAPIYIPGSTSNYPSSSEPVVIDPMLERLRRQERQKEVERDAQRLVTLTAKYQAELKSTGPTATTDRYLKDIQKLAHNVRANLTQ